MGFKLNKFREHCRYLRDQSMDIVPIYSFGIWIGAKLLAIDDIIPDIDWAHLSMQELLHTMGRFKHFF